MLGLKINSHWGILLHTHTHKYIFFWRVHSDQVLYKTSRTVTSGVHSYSYFSGHLSLPEGFLFCIETWLNLGSILQDENIFIFKNIYLPECSFILISSLCSLANFHYFFLSGLPCRKRKRNTAKRRIWYCFIFFKLDLLDVIIKKLYSQVLPAVFCYENMAFQRHERQK